MHAIAKTAALSLTMFAMACGGKSTQSASNGMDDGLRKDLQLASSPNLELASTARAQQRQMVVSDIERTPGMAPARAVTKKKVPPKPAAPARKPTVVEVQSPKPTTPAPVVVAQAAPEAPAPDPEPAAAPRPEPPAVVYPVPSTEGSRGHGGLGGIIGVVIRGGVMDGDHCDPRGMGRHGGISINNRLPSHPSFPIPRD